MRAPGAVVLRCAHLPSEQDAASLFCRAAHVAGQSKVRPGGMNWGTGRGLHSNEALHALQSTHLCQTTPDAASELANCQLHMFAWSRCSCSCPLCTHPWHALALHWCKGLALIAPEGQALLLLEPACCGHGCRLRPCSRCLQEGQDSMLCVQCCPARCVPKRCELPGEYILEPRCTWSSLRLWTDKRSGMIQMIQPLPHNAQPWHLAEFGPATRAQSKARSLDKLV